MRSRPMIVAVALLLMCAGSISVWAFGKGSLSGSQLLFQGTGSGTFNAQQVQYGFSVHCYASNCVGAIVFANTVAKTAVNYVTGTVTELQPDMYMMSVSTPQAPPSALPPTSAANISCSLANIPPVTQGQTNTVTMNCSSPAGSGSSQSATVLVPNASAN